MQRLSEMDEQKMNPFIPVGLDIRVPLGDGWPTAEAIDWPRDEELYEAIQETLGLQENFFQLLDVLAESTALELRRMVSQAGATLIMLELLEATADAYLPARRLPVLPDSWDWTTLGLDVCDINGFFSALRMNEHLPLFRETEILEAFACAEKANILVPPHSPFVVVRLRSLA